MAEESRLTSNSRVPAMRRDGIWEGMPRVELTGSWTLPLLAQGMSEIRKPLAAATGKSLAWDLRALTSLDLGGALLLWQTWGETRPPKLQMQPNHEPLFESLEQRAGPASAPRPVQPAVAVRLGAAALAATAGLAEALRLAGQLGIDFIGWLRRPQSIAWREISANVYRAGAQAMPITALVGFLVGMTLSYLTSKQLRTFGADIFVVDILGIGIWREIGPLLAAILVAGRSGSSMTAQLGVMRVTQELDALSVMCISHTGRLVLPKVVGLAVAMPLVAAWTSLVMLLGGMVAAKAQLGIDYLQFIDALPAAVGVGNVVLGLSKSILFGALIALVACHYGLLVEPNTESLGAGTTSSVVSSITVVVIVDALVAVMFSDVGF